MSCGHMCVSAGSRKIFNPDGGRRRGLLQPQLQTCRPSCKIAIEEYIGGTRRQILWRYRTVCTIPCVGPVDHAEEQHCIDIRVTVTRRFGTHILKSIANEGDQLSLLGDDLLAVIFRKGVKAGQPDDITTARAGIDFQDKLYDMPKLRFQIARPPHHYTHE